MFRKEKSVYMFNGLLCAVIAGAAGYFVARGKIDFRKLENEYREVQRSYASAEKKIQEGSSRNTEALAKTEAALRRNAAEIISSEKSAKAITSQLEKIITESPIVEYIRLDGRGGHCLRIVDQPYTFASEVRKK